mgnify:FL=1
MTTTASRRKRKPKAKVPPAIMTLETNAKQSRPDAELIPLSRYREDFINRMAINNYEVKQLYKDSQWLEDKVRPKVVSFVANIKPNFNKLVDQVKQAAP